MSLKRCPKYLVCVLIGGVLSASGCVTRWQETGVLYKPVKTIVSIESEPRADVRLQHLYVLGRTPVFVTIHYKQKIAQMTRKVSYWTSKPDWAAFLSVGTLGLYLPFSLLPVDRQHKQQSCDSYLGNVMTFVVSAPGYIDKEVMLELIGQEERKELIKLKKIKNQEEFP